MNGKDEPRWEPPLRGKIQSGFPLWRIEIEKKFFDSEKSCFNQCGRYKQLQNGTEVRENA